MEKKAVGRSIYISARKKSSVGVLREQSEQYPIFPSYKEDKMADNYDGMAVGVFELDNLVACFVALDAASKAANVTIQSSNAPAAVHLMPGYSPLLPSADDIQRNIHMQKSLHPKTSAVIFYHA